MKKLLYVLALVGFFGIMNVSCEESEIVPSGQTFENGGNGNGSGCPKTGCN